MQARKNFLRFLCLNDIPYLVLFVIAIVVAVLINDSTIKLIAGSIALLDLVFFLTALSKRYDTFIYDKKNNFAYANVQRNVGSVSRPVKFINQTVAMNESEQNIGNLSYQANDTTKNKSEDEAMNSESNLSSENENFDHVDENNEPNPPAIRKDYGGDDFSSVRIVGKVKRDAIQQRAEAVSDKTGELPDNPQQLKSSEAEEHEAPKFDFSVFFDEETLIGNDPKKEFDYIVSKLLLIFKTVSKTNTAVFVMASPDASGYIIQSYVTKEKELFTKKRHIEMGSDLISRIMQNKSAEIINDINPAALLDLLPYYVKRSQVSSFIGVPVMYKNDIIGIIAADSDMPNAYNDVTMKFLGNFSKIISASVQGFIHKIDLVRASKTLDAIKLFNSIAYDGEGNQNISGAITDTLCNIFENTRTGVCGFNEADNTWEIKSSRSSSDDLIYKIGDEIDMKNSAIGKSIINNSTVVLEINENTPVRINKNDKQLEYGHFIAVPVKSPDNTFGALFIEREVDQEFTLFEIGLLEMLAEQSGNAIERLHFIEALRSAAMYDLNLEILNTKAFYIRLSEELSRSADFKIPLSLCLFKIDKYSAFDPENMDERTNLIIRNVIYTSAHHIAPYDLFGRIDPSTFAILLAGTTPQNAKIWAEKLRNNIANSIVEVENHKFTVTVSIGLAQFEPENSAEQFIENALNVLHKSMTKTNCVTVYN